MITNITADKNYLTSIHDTKLRCWLSGGSFFQKQKPFDLQKIKIRNAYWTSNWIETSSTRVEKMLKYHNIKTIFF